MNLRLTNLLIFIFLAANTYSQEKQTIITGKIFSFNNAVSNVNILNLNNSTGTISNNNGKFGIKVHLNDTLLFSSIQYEKIKKVVIKSHLDSKKMNVQLIPVVNHLKEVFLHGLSGSLTVDLNKTPNDTLPKHNFILKKNDFTKKSPPDIHGFQKAPNAAKLTDPNYIEGMGISTGPDKRIEAKLKLKRELKSKKEFPFKIKKDLGINYFTNNLKIPEEKINHFLAYCEYKNIIEAYYKNNLLEVIKILREESKTYHEIKN